MALILKDRVQETTTTTGTGTLTLGGAVTGYQAFTAIGNANTTYYAIYASGGSEWEVGIGTYTASGTTLSRDTVLSSSNSGSLVNFSAGTKNVWCDYPAGKAMFIDAAGAVRSDGNSYLDFASASPTLAAGRMWYNGTDGNWNLGMGGGNITQQVGEELFVYGKASAAITDSPLQCIYQTGTVGASGVITFAPTIAGITDGESIIGIATESLALNGFGRITSFGTVRGITTNGTAYGETWADGDKIWYNPVTGGLTKVKPVAPNIKVQVGIIINAGSGGSGSFSVELAHGSELGGTDSNVQLTSPTAAQLLTYSTTDGYWKNNNLAAGTGISVNNAASGVVTVTNSSPDQTVAIASGTGISVTGTYPSFTVTNTSPSSGGTVTGVTGTAPIASSGGTAPAISISQATTSTDGYLSSTDWNTFNSKGSGTVTSVTGTAPVVSSGGATPAISMAAATTSVSGYLTSTDWNTFNGKQDLLVSGTNIKTINSTSILGSGNLAVSATPAGSDTQIQYNNAGALGASSALTFASSTLTAPNVTASNGIISNNGTVGASFTIASGYNAMSVGPVTVASGQSVTVPSGSRWVVL
jgi:hypothetical protein